VVKLEQADRLSIRGAPALRVVVCLLLLCQAIACFVGRGPSLKGKVDLRAFYAAGTILRIGHGVDLYDYDYQERVQNVVVSQRNGALPFLYPAFAALPFIPLSLVSYRTAFLLWSSVNLGLLVFVGHLLRPWLSSFRGVRWYVLPVVYGCLFGVSVAFMQGQISFLLLVVYCSAWTLLRRNRIFLAGLLMSVGLMKFQIAIPIFLLFCVWKQWRVVYGFLVGAVVVTVTSVAMVGASGMVVYWHSMLGMTKQTAFHAAAAKARYGMFPADMPNLHGLTFGLSHGATWGLVLNVVLCCIVLGFAARQKASLLVALPAAMLVSYHMQPHDLTLLLLPLSFELDELLRRAFRYRNGDRRALRTIDWILASSMLLLILPLATMVLAWGVNYLISLTVCAIMVGAARMSEESEVSSPVVLQSAAA
jgi:hypothetical protein